MASNKRWADAKGVRNVNFFMPKERISELNRLAQKEDCSRAELIRRIIEAHIESTNPASKSKGWKKE